MIYQVRRCDGPDGSSDWRKHKDCRSLLGALRAVRDVRKVGAAAYIRMRLCAGAPWHALSNAETDRYAAQYRITGWIYTAASRRGVK